MRTLEEINLKLAEAAGQVEQARALDAVLQQVQEQKLRCQMAVEQAQSALEEEEEDVEEMERLSIASLFARLKGNLEERTARERREAVEAKQRCEAACCDLAQLETRLEETRRVREQLGEPQKCYEQLLREKEAVLLSGATPEAQRLDEILRRIEALEEQLREVEEANAAGREAHLELEHMSNELANTADWDHLDLMDGETVHATIRKEQVDRARQQSEKACAALERLRRELWDVVFQNVPDVQLDDFTSFTDCLGEGVFDELFVQEKLQRAQDGVTDALCEVEHAMSLLRERKSLLQPRCEELKQERLALLLK